MASKNRFLEYKRNVLRQYENFQQILSFEQYNLRNDDVVARYARYGINSRIVINPFLIIHKWGDAQVSLLERH